MRRACLAVITAVLVVIASCGGGSEDLSYTNPEWRGSVNAEVTFPLSQRITLRVGLSGGAPPENSETVKWLEDYTNVDIVFVSLGSSPGDISLGGVIRSGKMPDIMPEGRPSMADESTRNLFVDFLEFLALTPNFNQLIEKNPDFRSGMLARTTPDDKLYSLGSYDADKFLVDGVIAYRRDLFEKHALQFDTWPELIESLRFLKKEYPDSYPLGGSFSTLMHHFPAWWGSGLHPDHIVYFDPNEGKWKMGLYELEFLDSFRVLMELAQEGLMSPDAFIMKDAETRRLFSADAIFLAPYTGMTGPSFGYMGDGYGSLGEDGEWDGTGKWIDAMPLPEDSNGNTTHYSSRFLDAVGKGWQVYNQSDHVAEAVALLDLLFSTEAALALGLGPRGKVWDIDGDAVVLKEPFAEAYRTGWTNGLQTEIASAGMSIGSPLVGLELDFPGMFGVPDVERLSYFIGHDMQRNRRGIDIFYQPGVRFPEDGDFRSDRAGVVVSLRTEIESTIAQVVIGQAPFSDLEKLVEDIIKYGDRLLDLYNTWCIVPDPGILPGG